MVAKGGKFPRMSSAPLWDKRQRSPVSSPVTQFNGGSVAVVFVVLVVDAVTVVVVFLIVTVIVVVAVGVVVVVVIVSV
eukprot:scaffold140895_cov21-Prasinocladus_malaysianus.AAC.1